MSDVESEPEVSEAEEEEPEQEPEEVVEKEADAEEEVEDGEDAEAEGAVDLRKVPQDDEPEPEVEKPAPIGDLAKSNPDIVTRFEYTGILIRRVTTLIQGMRLGLKPYVKTEANNPLDIAKEEFFANKLPYIIRRYVEAGRYIDVKLKTLHKDHLKEVGLGHTFSDLLGGGAERVPGSGPIS